MKHLQLVIAPTISEKPNYSLIYSRCINQKIKNFTDTIAQRKQLIYLGIKGIPFVFKEVKRTGFNEQARTLPSKERIEEIWNFMQLIDSLLMGITPRELTQIFPIQKKYNGVKTETKDYFFTMEELNKIGMDNPIGEHLSSLLFDYQNRHITKYEIAKLNIISDLQRYDGQSGLMEEFLSKSGIPSYKMMQVDNTKFLYDVENHTTIPLKTSIPKYLKVVK